MTTTPNMLLVLPDDHGSLDVWGALLNTIFGLIDTHTHATGLGVQVPTAGININADLAANTHAITGLSAVDFTPVATTVVSGFAGALFVNSSDNELYYRTTAGVNVKVTNGAALNVTAFTGGIGGDYSAVGALFSFDDATDSYWAQQQVVAGLRAWAGLRVGNVDLYEQAASITNRVRLKSPAGLGASYTITFPAAVPGAAAAVQSDINGTLTFSNTFTQNLTSTDFRYTTTQSVQKSGCEWEDPNGTHTKLLAASGAMYGWTLAASANVLTLQLDVRAGDVIDNYFAYVQKNTNAAATIACKLYRVRDSITGAESAVSTGTSSALNAPGYISLSETGIAHTVASGYQYYAVFTPSGSSTPAADHLLGFHLGISRP